MSDYNVVRRAYSETVSFERNTRIGRRLAGYRYVRASLALDRYLTAKIRQIYYAADVKDDRSRSLHLFETVCKRTRSVRIQVCYVINLTAATAFGVCAVTLDAGISFERVLRLDREREVLGQRYGAYAQVRGESYVSRV